MRFSPRLALLAVALALTVENTAELDQRRLGNLLGLPAATVGAVLLALVAAAWARWALRAGGEQEVRWPPFVLPLLRFLPALALADTILVYPETRPATWSAASGSFYLAALAALLVTAAWARIPRRAIVAVALAVGLILRLLLIVRDHGPLGGDMQRLVDTAAGELLHGKAPYHWYYFPWPVPLTYLPGSLLAYLPGHALGLVPRWTNLAADCSLVGMLLLAARRDRREHDHPALLIVAAAFLLQGPLEWFRITAHLPGWTLLAAALLATVRRHRVAGALWGLALAASAFAAPFFPLALVATARERGWRVALRLAARAGAVAALLILPFVIWSPRAFFEGALSWFGDVEKFPALRWHSSHTWVEYPGLAGLFWTYGLQRWLQPLQIVTVAGLVLLFARKGGRLAALPAHGVAVSLAFVLTNHMLWPYFYQPALVAALCAVVTAQAGAGNQMAPAGSISARTS
jgi:hypothetical protein